MRPHLRQIGFLFILLCVYLATQFFTDDESWVPRLAIAVAILLLIDAWLAIKKPLPSVARDCAHSVPLGVWTELHLVVSNQDSVSQQLEVFDLAPSTFLTKGMPQTVTIPAKKSANLSYRIKPMNRGDFDFKGCQIRIHSPLGLWTRRVTCPAPDTIAVLPNFAPVTKFAMLAVDQQLNSIGLRQVQRRGEGMEFHQLRNYRVGDTFRQIDWKATARAKKFITKEYRDEQNQQVVFMLDTGRRMLTREAEYSHFDHVLNAMLLLTYVALRQGDSVGFTTFGASNDWVPPRKGNNVVNSLLSQVYRIQPQPIATDYRSAAQQLLVRQKRRALVVILTNVRNEDNDDLQAALRLLGKHHLVLLASIREQQLDQVLEQPIADLDDAVMYSSTAQYLQERDKAHNTLRTPGVIIQDSVWNQLAPDITNRYLAIKKSGRL